MEKLLLDKLAVHAEAERDRLGFAWSEARRDVNYQSFQEYGRVYPGTIEPSEADAERCAVIEARLTEIEDAYEDSDDPDALEAENERLNEEYEMLTTGWAERDLASAGVIAWWKDGEIAMVAGLVRPEDRRDRSGEATSAAWPRRLDGRQGRRPDPVRIPPRRSSLRARDGDRDRARRQPEPRARPAALQDRRRHSRPLRRRLVRPRGEGRRRGETARQAGRRRWRTGEGTGAASRGPRSDLVARGKVHARTLRGVQGSRRRHEIADSSPSLSPRPFSPPVSDTASSS